MGQRLDTSAPNAAGSLYEQPPALEAVTFLVPRHLTEHLVAVATALPSVRLYTVEPTEAPKMR